MALELGVEVRRITSFTKLKTATIRLSGKIPLDSNTVPAEALSQSSEVAIKALAAVSIAFILGRFSFRLKAMAIAKKKILL